MPASPRACLRCWHGPIMGTRDAREESEQLSQKSALPPISGLISEVARAHRRGPSPSSPSPSIAQAAMLAWSPLRPHQTKHEKKIQCMVTVAALMRSQSAFRCPVPTARWWPRSTRPTGPPSLAINERRYAIVVVHDDCGLCGILPLLFPVQLELMVAVQDLHFPFFIRSVRVPRDPLLRSAPLHAARHSATNQISQRFSSEINERQPSGGMLAPA